MFKIYKFLFFTTLLIVPSSHYSWSAITCARKEYIVKLPPMKLSLRNSHHNTSVVDSGYCETHILDLILLLFKCSFFFVFRPPS